jgi:methyl-accepting chemotaxis protein
LGFFLSALIVLSGGTGLFYLKKIQNVLMGEGAPLIKISGEIIGNIRGVHNTVSLEPRNDKQIQEMINAMDESDRVFKERVAQLIAISTQANIKFDAQTIVGLQKDLMKISHEVVSARQKLIARETTLAEGSNISREHEKAINNIIVDFSNRNQAEANQKEDRGRTLEQSGTATAQDISAILGDLYETNVFYICSAAKLRQYMLLVEDISKEYMTESDTNALPELDEEFRKNIKRAESRLKMMKFRASGGNRQDIDAFEKRLADYKKLYLDENGMFTVYKSLLSTVAELRDLHYRFESVSNGCEQEAINIAEKLDMELDKVSWREVVQAQKFVSVVVIFGILISMIGIWRIIKRITVPIDQIVSEIQLFTEDVTSASAQVSNASHSVAQETSEQAASLEEAAASLEEISSMTHRSAENADHANDLMNAVVQSLDNANTELGDLTKSMEEILTSSKDAFNIVKSINEIAFQTNLLALNASVEAARAGKAGGGFSIVAEEVRKLAKRAADAANETAVLIECTVEKINNGSELMARTNDAFTHVVDRSSETAALVNDITSTSREQAQQIEHIKEAIAELDYITQQNAMNAENSSSAAEMMNTQSEQMDESVKKMAMLIIGNIKKNGKQKKFNHIADSKNKGSKTRKFKWIAA